jgi:hypothetical protein
LAFQTRWAGARETVFTKEDKMGSKAQRQNQHMRRINSKIRKFKKKGKSVEKLEKELAYMLGEERPTFRTGREADPRLKKYR